MRTIYAHKSTIANAVMRYFLLRAISRVVAFPKSHFQVRLLQHLLERGDDLGLVFVLEAQGFLQA